MENTNKSCLETFVVDSKWLIKNGLVDVNRDVLMKLIKIINDNEKTRNVIGMTMVFYVWSKQKIFYWARIECERGYAFRIKYKDNTYWYGKEKDIDKVCSDYHSTGWVFSSLSKTKSRKRRIKKEDVTEFEFGKYSDTSIINSFLNHWTSLKTPPTIPNSVIRIGNYFLSDCTSLTNPPTIPNSVLEIGDFFLSYCTSLASPSTIPNSLVKIGDYFLSHCTSLTSPPTIPNSVVEIGDFFLSHCTSLTSPPTIPNSVIRIGGYFLSHCTSLTSPPTIPNSVVKIGDYFLSHCTSLTSPPTIPNSVKRIGRSQTYLFVT